MPKKKKAKKFTADQAVREMARERVGAPKASRAILPRKAKPEKHKPTLGRLLDQE